MRKFVTIIIAFIMSGCLLPMPYTIYTIVGSYKEFTSNRILSAGSDTSIGKLVSLGEMSFKEFGCDSSIVAEFSRASEKYTIEITSFATQRGAYGAYFSMKEPSHSQPLKLDDYALKTDRFIQCVKGKYIIFIFPADNGTIDGAVELATGLTKRMGRTIFKPKIYEELPATNSVHKSQFFFMGDKFFTTRFPTELAQVLHIKDSVYGLSAQYLVDSETVELLKIRYSGREQTLGAVNSFLAYNKNRPIIQPRETLIYYTVIEPDRSEDYIAECGEWLYFIRSASPDGKVRAFFEYLIRDGK
jgi:hypothetical protein